ncbi:MAG TPA: DUF4278 domain-containing protein [Synechococcales cyanobacterium M55_K2018_004]|nr:DUF4278 domain-containing protein [Synechococcales cyanobacterium M55_K2018_004]
MQLSYRGIPYKTQSPAIEVTETNQLGLFLGNRFKIKHTNVIRHHEEGSYLKYRGVDYQQ